jgi:hypothetical protein
MKIEPANGPGKIDRIPLWTRAAASNGPATIKQMAIVM